MAKVTMGILVRRQLAVFEALRRLGFSADDVFVAYNKGDPRTVLRALGKEFQIQYVGPHGISAADVPPTEAQYLREWQDGAVAWRDTLTDAERDEIYRDGMNEEKLLALVVALDGKGIAPPRLTH